MVRGDPLDDEILFAEGYDQGLGVLSGFAIDLRGGVPRETSELQRLVAPDGAMYALVLDPDAVAIVEHSTIRVLGDGSVRVVQADDGDGPKIAVVEAPTTFDYLTWRPR